MTLTAGMRVRDTNNLGRLGTITNAAPRQRPSGIMWQVRWDGSTPSYEYEQSLEVVESDIYADPYELVRQGKWSPLRLPGNALQRSIQSERAEIDN